jgi:phosphoglycerol transferase
LPIIFAVDKFGFNSNNVKYPVFFSGDELIYASSVLSFSRGTPLFNSNMGGIRGQELNFAFLSVDSGPTFVAGLISSISGQSPFFGINILFILGFGLASLSGYFAARVFGVSNLNAAVTGIIISILPFHFLTVEWLTLSSYFFLPLLFALSIKRIYFAVSAKEKVVLYTLLILNGIWYSYYALGFLFLIITLVTVSSLRDLSSKSIRGSLDVILLTMLSFLVVAIPALMAKKRAVGVDYFGERDPWAAIVNSTTLIHYITPYPSSWEDRISSLFLGKSGSQSVSGLQSLMNGTGLFAEGWKGAAPWGVLAFIFLIGIEISRGKPRNNSETFSIMKFFYAAALISLSLSLVGGLGNVFALTVSGILRGYARYSIFVLILFVISIALYLDSGALSKKWRSIGAALFLLIPIGMTLNLAPVQAGTKTNQYHQTVKLEKQFNVAKGCSILQLPIVHFPYESPGYPTYRLLRFGLISDKFNWSGGFVGGSPSHASLMKLKDVQKVSLSEVIKVAQSQRYCGLLIDEEAWTSVSGFKPWPEYESGLQPIEKFIVSNDTPVTIRVFQTEDTNYYWLKL